MRASRGRGIRLAIRMPPSVLAPPSGRRHSRSLATCCSERHVPRRRLLRRGRGSRPAIIAIAAGAAAVLALVVVAVFGAAGVVTQFTSTAQDAIESAAGGSNESEESEIDAVERYESSETHFTFPAALELYHDGRLDAECSFDYVEGCWQTAVFPDAGCDTMQVDLAFSNSPTDPAPEHVETVEKHDVRAGRAVDVVFGDDEYDYGWVNDVMCLETAS